MKRFDDGLSHPRVAVDLGCNAVRYGHPVAAQNDVHPSPLGLTALQRGRQAELPSAVLVLTPRPIDLGVEAKLDAVGILVQLAIGGKRQPSKVPLATRLHCRACGPFGQERPRSLYASELRLHRDANVIARSARHLGANLHLARIQPGMLGGDTQVHQRQGQPLQRRGAVDRLHAELPIANPHKLGHRRAGYSPGRDDLHVHLGRLVPRVGTCQAHTPAARALRRNALNGRARPHAGRGQHRITYKIVSAREKALHGGHGSNCARAAPCSMSKTL